MLINTPENTVYMCDLGYRSQGEDFDVASRLWRDDPGKALQKHRALLHRAAGKLDLLHALVDFPGVKVGSGWNGLVVEGPVELLQPATEGPEALLKLDEEHQEAEKALALIDPAVAGARKCDDAHRIVAPLTMETCANAYQIVENSNVIVENVFLNAHEFADIRKAGRDMVNLETRRRFLWAGIQGSLWAARLITSKRVPAGTVILTGEGFDPEDPQEALLAVIAVARD